MNPLHLFFQPRRFFNNEKLFGAKNIPALAAICYSLARVLNRVDRQLTQADMGGRNSQADMMSELALFDSWLDFWPFILLIAAIGSPLIWWIGGWWYSLRIRWSDVPERDGRKARVVYVYSALIESVPVILVAVIHSFVYANYYESWVSDSLWEALLLVFPFWALVVSYIGVRTVFPVTIWKARLWFLIVPCLLYTVGLVLLIVAVELIGNGIFPTT
ncbi:MAG: YIP1 family protein [Chloroflexota bacterium]